MDDLTPVYAATDAAIVPLRAGGGTRIKILEAFAHGVPVVSTPAGAEGLDIADGRELLLGADAETFVGACVRLAQDSSLGARLSTVARAFVAAHHTSAALTALG